MSQLPEEETEVEGSEAASRAEGEGGRGRGACVPRLGSSGVECGRRIPDPTSTRHIILRAGRFFSSAYTCTARQRQLVVDIWIFGVNSAWQKVWTGAQPRLLVEDVVPPKLFKAFREEA